MAKCKICGKSGLFFKLDKNGKCKDCAYKAIISVDGKPVVFDVRGKTAQTKGETIEEELVRTNPDYRELKNGLDHLDKLIASIQDAREQYKADKDIDKLIAAYEYAMIKANPPLKNAQSHTMYLAELYIKSNQNDKAWSYLNSILFSHKELTGKIRYAQFKVLKKEKKYADAMEMLMLSYLFGSKMNHTFRESAFVKEATTIANKLNWDSEKVGILAQIVGNQVQRKNYDESELIRVFRNALSQFCS